MAEKMKQEMKDDILEENIIDIEDEEESPVFEDFSDDDDDEEEDFLERKRTPKTRPAATERNISSERKASSERKVSPERKASSERKSSSERKAPSARKNAKSSQGSALNSGARKLFGNARSLVAGFAQEKDTEESKKKSESSRDKSAARLRAAAGERTASDRTAAREKSAARSRASVRDRAESEERAAVRSRATSEERAAVRSRATSEERAAVRDRATSEERTTASAAKRSAAGSAASRRGNAARTSRTAAAKRSSAARRAAIPASPIVPILILVLVIEALAFGIFAVTGKLSSKTQDLSSMLTDQDISEGLAFLDQEGSRSIDKVINTINELNKEKRRQQLAENENAVWAAFDDSVIVGDSRVVGFYYHEFLPESRAISEGGAMVRDIPQYLDRIVAMKPLNVFLAFGLNDYGIGEWPDVYDYTDVFVENVNLIKKELPGVEIYVNSTLPAVGVGLSASPAYPRIPEYNEALREMCIKEGYHYIDNDQIAAENEDLYDEDGLHLQKEMYLIWAINMLGEVFS